MCDFNDDSKQDLEKKLLSLADKYETPSFMKNDPSQFLHYYDVSDKKFTIQDTECASFIAAMLSFGNRKQFIPKIRYILDLADKTDNSISAWLKNGTHGFGFSHFPHNDFFNSDEKFYRFYSYNDMLIFFDELSSILETSEKENDGTLGSFFRQKWEENKKNDLADLICQEFPKSKIVPKGENSAKKRIYMFLRWMVRQNSCVDLGIWDWYEQNKLLIPLDTHVMQEAIKMGLLSENAKATKKTAQDLTTALSIFFPGDPARADYALFGIGVEGSFR